MSELASESASTVRAGGRHTTASRANRWPRPPGGLGPDGELTERYSATGAARTRPARQVRSVPVWLGALYHRDWTGSNELLRQLRAPA